jgi:hypothetical protein
MIKPCIPLWNWFDWRPGNTLLPNGFELKGGGIIQASRCGVTSHLAFCTVIDFLRLSIWVRSSSCISRTQSWTLKTLKASLSTRANPYSSHIKHSVPLKYNSCSVRTAFVQGEGASCKLDRLLANLRSEICFIPWLCVGKKVQVPFKLLYFDVMLHTALSIWHIRLGRGWRVGRSRSEGHTGGNPAELQLL